MSNKREWYREWKTRYDAGALAKEYGPIPPGPWDDEPSKVQWVLLLALGDVWDMWRNRRP